MKKMILFATALALMTLTACGGSNNNKGASGVGVTARPPGANGQQYTSSSGYGYVSSQNLQSNIVSMFGSFGSQVGNIASYPDGNTGVFFQGSVNSNTAVLTGSAQATGGTMTFQVWDSFVGQTDSSGKQIPPVVLSATLASAQLNASQSQLVFNIDAGQSISGQIGMQGSFNQTTFQGTLVYSGGGSGSQQVGSFSVATCAFLRCQ